MAKVARVCLNVCLIGPECTGKTTFAQRLGDEFGAPWVPEFAREYALRVQRVLTAEDVEPIAKGQIALDNAKPRRGGLRPPELSWAGDDRDSGGRRPPLQDLVILDTDLISTVVYARHYYGACPEWIERAAHARRADLYLLLDRDVPWLADPARDASGDAREHLFEAFRAALDEFETTWTIVSGGWEERWGRVRGEVDRIRGT